MKGMRETRRGEGDFMRGCCPLSLSEAVTNKISAKDAPQARVSLQKVLADQDLQYIKQIRQMQQEHETEMGLTEENFASLEKAVRESFVPIDEPSFCREHLIHCYKNAKGRSTLSCGEFLKPFKDCIYEVQQALSHRLAEGKLRIDPPPPAVQSQ